MTPVQKLSDAFVEMHQFGAARMCASSDILMSSFLVNGLDARLSIIAAISTMGGHHAPLIQTQLLLEEVLKYPSTIQGIVGRYSKRNRISGFGSGFVKGAPDPIHEEIDELMKEFAPKIHYYMTELLHAVHDQISDQLFFNTAMYSAAYGIMMNISPYIMPGVAIEARMPVWNRLLTQTMNQAIQSVKDKETPL